MIGIGVLIQTDNPCRTREWGSDKEFTAKENMDVHSKYWPYLNEHKNDLFMIWDVDK